MAECNSGDSVNVSFHNVALFIKLFLDNMNVILRWVRTGYYQVYYMGSRQIFHYLCLICFFSSLHAVKQIIMSWSLSVCGCVAAGWDGSAAVNKWPWADSGSWLPATICCLLAQTQAALKNNEESLRFMELFIIKLKLNIHAEIIFCFVLATNTKKPAAWESIKLTTALI